MSRPERRRPQSSEYAEYYDLYIRRVPDGDIIDIMRQQLATCLDLFESIPEERAEFRYAPDKWTTKEVIGHIIDVEWVFTVRGLRMARGDQTPLPGMEQDDFVAGANFGERSLSHIVNEFRHLRSANIALFESMSEEILDRTGMASDCRFSVRSIPYILAGHATHHLGMLKEKYL